ncbi:MAG: Ig-like domain-containing protein, partial [Cytophagia bacterium]|nr:Ig-like domain-containing protein [Cytophagia bacterium]
MINFNSINKSLMKNMGSALVNMAMIASPLSTGAATNAYYAARKANYGRNNSYLIDEGLNSLRTGRWSNNLASKKDRTNIETASSADDLVLRKNVAVRELVVVDSHIKNRELFSKLIRPGVELVRIDGNSNGFDVLMNKLGAYEELDAIHLFAHGQQGQILLGNQLVAKTTIETSVQAFSRFNHTLKEGGELRVYNSELENINTADENLEISKGDVAKPSASKISINSEDLSINKGDINAYPEVGSIARMDLSDAFHSTTFTFDYDSEDFGANTKHMEFTQGSYTIKIESTTEAMTNGSPFNSYLSSLALAPETVWKFSLAGGQTFDLESLVIQEYRWENTTIYLEASNSNKSADISFSSGELKTITEGIGFPNGDFDGITHFFIKGKTTIGGVPNAFVMALTKMIFTNITAANSAPVIGGTSAGQTVNDITTITPFSAITVTDGDNDSVSATITLDAAAKGTLSGTGLSDDGDGVYSISSTTDDDLQSKLRALVFTPTANRSVISETTTFTVEVSDGTDSDSDNTTTVISSAVGPVISEITAVTTPTNDNTPSYTFTTNETGTFSLGGSCGTSSSTTIGGTGNQTITLTQTDNSSALSDGTYSDCTITVTDDGGKASSPLSISSFTVDTTPPTLSSSSPTDDASGINTGSDITLTFNENIAFGTGNIEVIDETDASNSFTIDVGNPGAQASISGAVLTINPGSNLDASSNYSVRIAATAIDDIAGNSYAGITNGTTLNFTTNFPPTLTVNNGLTVNEGENGLIDSGKLNASDTEGGTLTFTVTTAVANGVLFIDTNPSNTFNTGDTELVVGATFSKDDLDNDRVRYTNSSGSSDSFIFTVSDINGGELTGQTFSITVNDVTAPTITSLGLNNSNAFIEIFTNEGVYNTNGGSGGLEISDIDISISGGSATDPVITSLKDGSDGTSDLTGGESIIRVNFTTTGVADGSETVTI